MGSYNRAWKHAMTATASTRTLAPVHAGRRVAATASFMRASSSAMMGVTMIATPACHLVSPHAAAMASFKRVLSSAMTLTKDNTDGCLRGCLTFDWCARTGPFDLAPRLACENQVPDQLVLTAQFRISLRGRQPARINRGRRGCRGSCEGRMRARPRCSRERCELSHHRNWPTC